MFLKLKKGFDIPLKGKPKSILVDHIRSDIYSFKPTNFEHILRPKLLVNEGDSVKAGTPIFKDKMNPNVLYCSPVSGEIVNIHRGSKRKPLEIKILADKNLEYEIFKAYNEAEIKQLGKEEILKQLISSGVWPNLIERPFGLIPKPENSPKSIFISAYDSNPLAPDYEFVFKGEEKNLQAGIDALQKLTAGKIHITVKKGNNSLFSKLQGVEIHEINGPHPAGNVGVQIHHIDPINKGDLVWTINPYGLQQVGRLFLTGKYDASKIIVLSGSELKNPQYYKTYTGASIEKFIEGNLVQENVRFISGNVLTGEKIAKDGCLGFYDTMCTVIPEGNYYEMFGWILPSIGKLSVHRAFGLFSFLAPRKERVVDTNMHGEERAFVETGVFERLVPMDIYPVYLLKSILAMDFEEMEALGILEVIEEDIALCEFADVSKQDIQAILREGIEAYLTA